ncbi:hypothetical protein Vadar_032637 [Vaccinium darrowii]|uniref:Uncharacterized protein n=1 Tax=Vaccinium darrowii TaxID=229202 RepID=A0ACB7XE91_9ERIC|nr:hypothetical protein Vadar_032637 [Vaccinium darrowii]
MVSGSGICAKAVVVDARHHMLGRLASIVAKEILNGQKVVLVRCEEICLSGGLVRQKMKYLRFLRKRMNTKPSHGPIHFRAPAKILWRTVRGMIPHKTKRGAAALARLKAYEGIPPPYDKKKRMVIPDALKVLRLQAGHKYCLLGRLSSEVGWNHYDTIRELEEKRKQKSQAVYERKKQLTKLRIKAEKAAEEKLGSELDILAPASNSSNFMHKPLAFTAGCGKQVASDYQTKFSKSRVFVDDKSPSFADIVAGKKNSATTASIKVQDEGDLWLSMSAIAKLPSQRSIESLREAFIAEGVWNVQLRPMGVDTKGQNMSRANPSVVLRAVDESDVNSFSSVDPAGDKDEDDGRDDELEGGTNNLDSNILIENSTHLSCFDVLESFVGETMLPILGDQAQISNLNVVDSSNSFVEESVSPLGNIHYEDKSIHVENCLEANQADENIFEDGAAYTSSGPDDSTSADLVSADPLINYVDYKRRKRKPGPLKCPVLASTCTYIMAIATGFLSLSCGGTTSFVDSSNMTWGSDSNYVTTGKTATVSFVEGTSASQVPIRFFPNSPGRKCYRLPVRNISSSILVRAQFLYKNYDGQAKPPAFTVSLGTAISTTVNLSRTDPWTEEFIWPVDKDVLPLCLQSIPDAGFPVISTLEVRPLPQGAYTTGLEDFSGKFLRKSYRINCGCNNLSLRYPWDQYDRIWDADMDFSPFHISTGFKVYSTFNLSSLKETPPAAVLQTARVPRKKVLTYNLPLDTLGNYYVVLYFAGILPISPLFDVLINGDVVQSNYTVKRLEVSALFITRKRIKSLDITLKSISRYPQINAIEVYEIVDIPSESSSTTVSALQVIQQFTGLDLGWEDDPCSPTPWDHIGCQGNSVVSLELSDITLRSISPTFGDLLDLQSLDLHNTSLAGEIQNLGSLQLLQKLNLSFNQLTSFGFDLEDLINLQILDLQNNSLQGIVPDGLGELKDLHLLTSGNLCLSFSSLTCNGLPNNRSIETPEFTIVPKKKHNDHSHLPIVLGAVAGAILVVLVVSLSVLFQTRRKKPEVTYTARAQTEIRNWNLAAKFFSYKEIKAATNKFKEVIGRGSFGTVYLGKLPDGKLVAVKVRFDKSQLGADSFLNEVSLLSQIRHQNLVSLEGFCHESKQQILVYEYLPGGSLADNLYGRSSKRVTLSWVRRLKIAVDAAKGIDYLHNGSDPRIIHRDVKSSNILMDTEMNAKAKPYLQAGAFQIVDESLNGTFDVESMRKAAFIASRSVERDASQRPCIAEVLGELKEAYSLQLSFLASSGHLH